MAKKAKSAKKDKKHRPQPKPNRQIPNSMIRPMKMIGYSHNLEEAREHPIFGCWIMEGWRESGLAPVVVAREQEPDRLMFGVYLVDLYCLGIKSVFTKTDYSVKRFESELADMCFGKPEKCSVELAHEVIYGALEYAQKLGFQPDPDFKVMRADVMLDPPDAHPRVDQVTFGKNGKPFFAPGPFEDAKKVSSILKTLERSVGSGNFDFLSGLDSLLSTFDDDADWKEDEGDDDGDIPELEP